MWSVVLGARHQDLHYVLQETDSNMLWQAVFGDNYAPVYMIMIILMMIICLIIPTTLWRALMACATPGQSPSLSPPRKEPCRSVVMIGTTFLRSSRCCSVVARRVVGRVCLTRLSRQILKLSAFCPSYGRLLILHTDLTLLSRQHLGLSALCPCHGGLLSLLIIDYLYSITCNNYAPCPSPCLWQVWCLTPLSAAWLLLMHAPCWPRYCHRYYIQRSCQPVITDIAIKDVAITLHAHTIRCDL